MGGALPPLLCTLGQVLPASSVRQMPTSFSFLDFLSQVAALTSQTLSSSASTCEAMPADAGNLDTLPKKAPPLLDTATSCSWSPMPSRMVLCLASPASTDKPPAPSVLLI